MITDREIDKIRDQIWNSIKNKKDTDTQKFNDLKKRL
jgi:hypothetical protein